MKNPKIINNNLVFETEADAIEWIIDWKDMSHPYEFLKSSIDLGYISIVNK